MKTIFEKKKVNKARVAFWGILLLAFFIAVISTSQINRSVTGFAVAISGNNLYLFATLLGLGCILVIAFIFILLRELKIRLAEEEMINWVYNARKMGYDDNKIKEMLSQYNWSPETIQVIIQSVDNRAPSTSSITSQSDASKTLSNPSNTQ